MGISVCSKALSDSELSDIYLRYDEENKTRKKLYEIANNSNSDSFALVEWLAYIAFGEDYIGMEKSYRIVDECVGRIEQAIHFWQEGRHQGYTSYMISLIEKYDYNDYAKEALKPWRSLFLHN